MAFLYVKNSLGTCVNTDGRLTKQTGAFGSGSLVAANVYATITSAITNGALADGDTICCSDLHNFDSGSTSITYTVANDESVRIESVDDTACDTYKKGAIERHTSGTQADITFSGRGYWRVSGMEFYPADQLNTAGSAGADSILWSCTIKSIDDGTHSFGGGDGCTTTLYDCDLSYDDTNMTDMLDGPNGGSKWVFYGGSISSADTTDVSLFKAGFQNGGGIALLNGVDISGVDNYILRQFGSSMSQDDLMSVELKNCHTNSNVSPLDETLTSKRHTLKMTGCGWDSAAEYQYYFATLGGSVSSIDTIYRDNSSTWARSGDKTSLKCVTLATATPESPFTFEFPSRYAELSDTASDVIRIYFFCDTVLDDGDVFASAYYPDGTNEHTQNLVESVTNGFSTMRTAGSLATNSEAWTIPVPSGSENYYQIDLDTSGVVGADGVPVILMNVATDDTIYFCQTLGLS